MEMWKTAAYADGKPIHSLWKRTRLSHRSANRFPTATLDQAVYAHSHNACCCEYPSYPFLSVIKNREKITKKSGSTAIGRTEKLYSRFCVWSYSFIFFSCFPRKKLPYTFSQKYFHHGGRSVFHSTKQYNHWQQQRTLYHRPLCRLFG